MMMSAVQTAGIDLGKKKHFIAIVPPGNAQRHKQYPTSPFANDRAGFETVLAFLKRYGDPAHTSVLLEPTGHYGLALEAFLQEHGVTVYRITTEGKYQKNKTDKLDAQALAAMLYTHVVLQAPQLGKKWTIRRMVPPVPAVRRLRGLVGLRVALMRERIRCQNKLTAICDELFPELTQIYKDPNGPSALQLREAFPLPELVAKASQAELRATRTHTRPGNKAFIQLQELATSTIGSKDRERQESLIFEQKILLKNFRTYLVQLDELDAQIKQIVMQTREGKILSSVPAVSPVTAGIYLCQIGNIANFAHPSDLRGYCGWSSKRSQTGTTRDHESQDKGGNRILKQTVMMMVMAAVQRDDHYKALYDRLLKKHCVYNERKKDYLHKMLAVGRVAGQMIGVIWHLLYHDAAIVAAAAAKGEPPPPPELFAYPHG